MYKLTKYSIDDNIITVNYPGGKRRGFHSYSEWSAIRHPSFWQSQLFVLWLANYEFTSVDSRTC